MGKTFKVGVLGATGAVGQEMIRILEERKFPLSELRLLSSANSAGTQISFSGEKVTVQEAKRRSFDGLDFVLGAAENPIAIEFAPAIKRAGAVFVDNSSAFRLKKNVPLVVPEINGDDAQGHNGIVSNPNCSTIITLMALYPLAKLSTPVRLVASTYQAVSGAGKAGLTELESQVKSLANGEKIAPPKAFSHQIAFNLIPAIGGDTGNGFTSEEMKLTNEGRKIMHLPKMKVSCTCVRVPVYRSHSISFVVTFKDEVTVEQARDAIKAAKGVTLVDDLANDQYPMPLSTSGGDKVEVGRIRKDTSAPKTLALWCCGDQIRKGAALNAVQILETLAK